MIVPYIDETPGQPTVRGFLHSPPNPSGDGLVLTHGAGANCESPLLVSVANAFCATGITVLRFDLPFRQLRPHGPPPRGSSECDQQGLCTAMASMRRIASARIFLGGHSYGGRQATMLAAAEPTLAHGLLLLAYPLHPPKRREELRTVHFPNLRTPALFVHGTRDGFGTIEEMTTALTLIPARTNLLRVQGVGHELLSKRAGNEFLNTIVESFGAMFRQ